MPTYGGDTILHIPKTVSGDSGDDNAFVLAISKKIFAAYVEFQDLPDEARPAAITKALAPLNVGAPPEVNPDRGRIFEFKPVG